MSSDDDEILSIARGFGSKVIKRDCGDATDEVSLDPVIYKALERASELEGKDYQVVITLQPTSPLLGVNSLDQAISNIISKKEVGTIISAVKDAHLTWGVDQNGFVPRYSARVNRQLLPPVYKETGGFLIARMENVSIKGRIGGKVDLYILSDMEAIDIDSHADWALCEYYLRRRRILFVVSGNREIGLGHVYNTLALASDLVEHELIFLVDKSSELAFDFIKDRSYQVFMQRNRNIIEDIKLLAPHLVINDRLDTDLNYVREIKKIGAKVINFEDLGSGAEVADITVNAMYPELNAQPNHYYGPSYFVLRDEFVGNKQELIQNQVNKVLLSFGGVDPCNLTLKVLESIYESCSELGIEVAVVLGMGYKQGASLEKFKKVKFYSNIKNIAERMREADLIFTSAGRTTFEIAALKRPCVVLAQNNRELTHFFANDTFGFKNLGLGEKVSHDIILSAFLHLVRDYDLRREMISRMSTYDLNSGRQRVIKLIKECLHI